MNEKYVLIKPFTCQYGTFPKGTEIVYFRNQVYINSCPIPSSFNGVFLDLIEDDDYVKKVNIVKNEF